VRARSGQADRATRLIWSFLLPPLGGSLARWAFAGGLVLFGGWFVVTAKDFFLGLAS